jgi:hypothetical protein
MTTPIRDEVSLREAIHELSLAKEVPDAELLEEFARRYPQHATALTEYAVEFVLDGMRQTPEDSSDEVSPEMSDAVSRAMSRFNNRLYEVENTAKAKTNGAALTSENPFANLDREGMRSLARNLNVNSAFVMKLRDCQIIGETVPITFQQRLAEELSVSPEVIARHVASQARIGAGMDFKSDKKPEASTKQTFEEAVRHSGLTTEQQIFLLSL